MPRPVFLLAFAIGCTCPVPHHPAKVCTPTPTCVQDAQGQPPQPEGMPCGVGVCDGKGACCN